MTYLYIYTSLANPNQSVTMVVWCDYGTVVEIGLLYFNSFERMPPHLSHQYDSVLLIFLLKSYLKLSLTMQLSSSYDERSVFQRPEQKTYLKINVQLKLEYKLLLGTEYRFWFVLEH